MSDYTDAMETAHAALAVTVRPGMSVEGIKAYAMVAHAAALVASAAVAKEGMDVAAGTIERANRVFDEDAARQGY